MDSESHQQLGYGLLRFRSDTSSLLGSFAENGAGKASPASEGFEADKFGSRFMGFSSSSNMVEEKLKESPVASPRGYTGLPPQYPRPSSGLSSPAMEASYGTVGSLGMDQRQMQPKMNSCNLARQSSSPAGLFSQLSTQNGEFLEVFVYCLELSRASYITFSFPAPFPVRTITIHESDHSYRFFRS